MAIDPEQLPNDPAALRQMVVGLLEDRDRQEQRLRQLQHWLEQLLRARYGPRRERVDENQLFLFAAEIMAQGGKTPPAGDGSEASRSKSASPRRGHGRGALPKSLKRERVVYDLEEEKRQCPECQGKMDRIGEDVSERLEYVPASLLPMFTHAEDDLKSFRMFTSQLVVNGTCTQAELVRAFGVSSISMKRHVKKLRAGGSQAFFAPRRKRKPRVLTPEVLQQAQELLSQGQGRSTVAQTLDLKRDTLSKAVRAGRLAEPLKKKRTGLPARGASEA